MRFDRRRWRRRVAAAAGLFLVLLFLVDPAPPPPRTIGGEPLASAGGIATDVQRAIDRYRREGSLPAFLPARSPGVGWRWPPVGWVLTFDDPVNMLVFVRNATREESVRAVREAFQAAGYSESWPGRLAFLTRYDRPVEVEMFQDFVAGGVPLQMHVRVLHAGEDGLLGHGWLVNGHAEFRASDVWNHLSGRPLPAAAVEAGPYLDPRGVKWESFERQIEAAPIGGAKISVNYSNEGYYFGQGRAGAGDPYYYVDGRLPVVVLEGR